MACKHRIQDSELVISWLQTHHSNIPDRSSNNSNIWQIGIYQTRCIPKLAKLDAFPTKTIAKTQEIDKNTSDWNSNSTFELYNIKIQAECWCKLREQRKFVLSKARLKSPTHRDYSRSAVRKWKHTYRKFKIRGLSTFYVQKLWGWYSNLT